MTVISQNLEAINKNIESDKDYWSVAHYIFYPLRLFVIRGVFNIFKSNEAFFRVRPVSLKDERFPNDKPDFYFGYDLYDLLEDINGNVKIEIKARGKGILRLSINERVGDFGSIYKDLRMSDNFDVYSIEKYVDVEKNPLNGILGIEFFPDDLNSYVDIASITVSSDIEKKTETTSTTLATATKSLATTASNLLSTNLTAANASSVVQAQTKETSPLVWGVLGLAAAFAIKMWKKFKKRRNQTPAA